MNVSVYIDESHIDLRINERMEDMIIVAVSEFKPLQCQCD